MLIDTMDTSNLCNLTDRLQISSTATLVGYHQLLGARIGNDGSAQPGPHRKALAGAVHRPADRVGTLVRQKAQGPLQTCQARNDRGPRANSRLFRPVQNLPFL
jgi:hypothetical protein